MKFDIILPTVGRSSLDNAIQSVVNQTFQDWHLWVVADGSFDDHVSDMMTGNIKNDNRIRMVFQEPITSRHNDYGSWARNTGIMLGELEWIAYVDDDDVWLPNHLTILSACAKLHPEANMLRTIGQSFSWRHKSPRSSKLVRKLGPVNSQDILTVGMSHTRELLNKTSGWLPVDNHDHILWREMLAAGGVSAIAQEVTFEFER